jgi:hypothetical protein
MCGSLRVMAGSLELPDLRIAPLEALHSHETFDLSRVEPLAVRLRAEGVLRNPPIALPLSARHDRLVILDGANRVEAFRRLHASHILVQVVHAGDSTVRLETWNHLLRGVHVEEVFEAILRYPELALIRSDVDRATFNLSAGASLAYATTARGEVFEIVGDTLPLRWRVLNLHRIVDAYRGLGRLERVGGPVVTGLEALYPDLQAVIVFPRLEIEEVVRAVSQGLLLPAGLTRFVVSPRALRVNYPLESLLSARQTGEKQAELDEWLRVLVANRRVRFYAESTLLFDE